MGVMTSTSSREKSTVARPFDHFIVAAADLEPMAADFLQRAGVTPTPGGNHPGRGTRNALLSLGESIYLELLATDRSQPLEGTMGAQLALLTTPQVFGYMMKGSDLDEVQAILARHQVEADLFEATRTTPEGKTLRWRLVVPRANRFGCVVPNFIDWGGSEHPSAVSAAGCKLLAFSLGHPRAEELGALLRELDCAIGVEPASSPTQRLSIATPQGPLTLTSTGWSS